MGEGSTITQLGNKAISKLQWWIMASLLSVNLVLVGGTFSYLLARIDGTVSQRELDKHERDINARLTRMETIANQRHEELREWMNQISAQVKTR